MSWPYQFLTLDKAAKESRRHVLNRYGFIAHASVLIPLLVFFLYRAGKSLARKLRHNHTPYSAVPGSPALKRQRQNASGSWAVAVRKAAWWLEDDINFLGRNWGQRGELVFGYVWTLWLLFLCVNGTGNGESSTLLTAASTRGYGKAGLTFV